MRRDRRGGEDGDKGIACRSPSPSSPLLGRGGERLLLRGEEIRLRRRNSDALLWSSERLSGHLLLERSPGLVRLPLPNRQVREGDTLGELVECVDQGDELLSVEEGRRGVLLAAARPLRPDVDVLLNLQLLLVGQEDFYRCA